MTTYGYHKYAVCNVVPYGSIINTYKEDCIDSELKIIDKVDKEAQIGEYDKIDILESEIIGTTVSTNINTSRKNNEVTRRDVNVDESLFSTDTDTDMVQEERKHINNELSDLVGNSTLASICLMAPVKNSILVRKYSVNIVQMETKLTN